MNRLFRTFLLLSLGATFATILPSCSSSRHGVTKVKAFHLVDGNQLTAADPAIPFEYKHYMHGAVSGEERRAREGHYYTVMWRVNQSGPVTLRFEYRQGNTGSDVMTKEVQGGEGKTRGTTDFHVTGEEYATGGKVTAWRVSVLQNGALVDTSQSFLWE